MLNRMSLKTKLIGAFGIVAFLLALVSGVNYYFISQIDNQYAQVTESNMPNMSNAFEMRVQSLIMSRATARLTSNLLQNKFDPKNVEDIEAALKEYEQSRTDYLKIDFFPGEKVIFDRLDAAYHASSASLPELIKIARTANADAFPSFQKIREKYIADYEPMAQALDELVAFHTKLGFETNERAGKFGEMGILASMILGIVGAITALSLGWFISARLGRDLSSIVERVEAASSEVAAAASQIATSSTELSESSTQQAAAIQETAASVDEVSAMIKKNSENAGRSADTSRSSKDTAESGSRQVETMVQSIGAIADANERIMRQVEEGNREIADIVKVINEIGSKTKVINDIVFQTKLLSFNASVEAARAGEHGKGFAVVAEEVGNLAQMSGNAAKEITEMLDASVKKVEGIVTRTKEGVAALIADAKHKVESGTDVAGNCGEALRQVTNSVNSVDQLVTEIAHASREQATGMGEITKAMAQLDQATSQNSTVSQQCAAASEQLSGQAQQMKQLVSELNELLRGAGQAPAPVAHVSAVRRAEKPSGNVVALKRPAAPARAPLKKAAGSDLPSADDPRFEDV